MKDNFTFHCFDLEFHVEAVDAWGGSVGLSRADTLEIRIDRNASEGMKQTALLHEFLHLVSYLFVLNLSEETVAFLGVMLPRYLWEGDKESLSAFRAGLRACEASGEIALTDNARASVATALFHLRTESPAVFRTMFSRRHSGEV